MKRSWTKPVSTRGVNVLSLPLQLDFPAQTSISFQSMMQSKNENQEEEKDSQQQQEGSELI
jgi:hypothetical protein